jgi:hypothetical protein
MKQSTPLKEVKDMKLSKAQERAIEDAKRMIDKARAYDTFEEYEGETDSYCKARGGAEYVRANMDYYEKYREYWEKYRQGDVLSHAGKNTIEALVRLGIFTVVEFDECRKNGVLDWIHLNNY